MLPPDALAALGLPPTWVPVPFAWALGKLEQRSPAGTEVHHVLRLDTPLGVLGVAFDADGARRLVDALSSQLSGLAVAHTLPPNGNVKHRP